MHIRKFAELCTAEIDCYRPLSHCHFDLSIKKKSAPLVVSEHGVFCIDSIHACLP